MRKQQQGTVTRRHFVRGGVAVVASLAAGCGESAERIAAPAVVPPNAATPGVVPGFTEPDKWAGWSLPVAAADSGVRQAVTAVIARPFAAATGCNVEVKVTDYAELVRSVEDGEPYANAVLVDPLWAFNTTNRDYLLSMRRPNFRQSTFHQSTFNEGAIDLFEVDEWSVPAYAYAMVNAYRPAAIGASQEPPSTWSNWWDQERYPGKRTLRKGALGTFEFALLADGVPAEDLYPLDFSWAIASLKRISGRIVNRWWEADTQPIDWLAHGRVEYASAWSHELWQARQGGASLDWLWNQGLLMADRWVIPDGVLNPDLVIDFLHYATHPIVQAALARAIGIGPVTSAAFAEIDPLFARRLPTAPDNLPLLINADVQWWSEHEVEAARWFNNWLLGVPNG
jgi:spermidine/putrescine-binding protein